MAQASLRALRRRGLQGSGRRQGVREWLPRRTRACRRSGRAGRAARPYRRGSMPELATNEAREVAVTSLRADIYAASSAPSVAARRSCYVRILRLWGEDPHPISADKVLHLAAGLKAGHYRSSDAVLSQLKVDAERAGENITHQIARAFTDATRACRRGLGPPKQPLPLDLFRMSQLSADPAPWVPGCPVGPRNAMVL